MQEGWDDGAVMFRLGAAEAAEVLAAVRDADGRDEVCDPDADSGLVTADVEAASADSDGDTSDVLIEDSSQVSADAETARMRPVWIRVFGPAAVSVRGEEIATGLRSDARNLLALLAIRKDGLTLDEIIDLMWPEVSFGTGGSRFHTAIKNVRGVLRATTGAASAGFVIRASGRYRLDPGLIDCDLWHFDAAIAQARVASACEREVAMRLAADAYTGPLLDGGGLEWAEPCREAARRTAADTLRHLADLTWDRDPDTALGWLDRAMATDELNEELHRHVMARQAELDRLDAVRRTWQRLEASLAAIGETPARYTRVLAERLTASIPVAAPAAESVSNPR
jgi:two-component SAPR family response regulator